MASIEKSPGRGQTAGPTPDWSNPNNILSSDSSFATVDLTSSATIGDYLRADQFGFDIPAMATIDGIVCSIQRKASAGSTIRDYSVVLLKNGTVPGGSDDKKDSVTYWGTLNSYANYGSAADLWNTTWTPADINSSTSGFAVRPLYVPAYGGATAYVDHMKMTVYYTVDGFKFGSTSVSRIYVGSTEIQAIYNGSTRIS